MASWRENQKMVDWVRTFYRQMGWGEANLDDKSTAGDAGSELEARRQSALTALKNLAVGAELLPENRRAYVKRRKDLGTRIGAAATIEDFDVIDDDIGQLRMDLDDQIAIAQARISAQSELQVAIAKREEMAGRLDEGSYRFLAGKIAEIRKAISDGTNLGQFQAARKLAQDFIPLADDAKKYGERFYDWARSTAAYVERSVDPADQDEVKTLRETVKKAASGLAQSGRFGEATTKLDDFKADPKVNGKDFADSAEFYVLYDEYRKTHQTMCENVLRAAGGGRVRDFGDYSGLFAEAKRLAFSQGDYTKAAKALKDLIDWCKPRVSTAKLLSRIDAKLSREKTFRDKVLTPMNDELDKKSFVGASNILIRFLKGRDDKGDNPELKKLADMNFSFLVDGRLEARKGTLAGRLVDPELSELNDAWTAHKQALANRPPDHNAANVQAGILRNLFQLESVLDLQAEATRIEAKTPGVLPYNYLADFTASMRARNYEKARSDITAAVPLMRSLVVYLDVVDEVTRVRDALPADPPDLRAGLTTALANADVKARAKDPVGATTDLQNALKGTDYLTLAQEISDYTTLLARVEKEQKTVLKLLGASGPHAALDQSLKDAKLLATRDGTYDLAYDALAAHQVQQKAAKEFGAERRQAIGLKDALLRATTDPAVSKTVFGDGTGRADMQAEFAAAELLATGGRFGDATKAFKDFAATYKAHCDKCAEHYEATDGMGSNAGHSIGRHGPDIKSDKLIRRVMTGMAPDDKESFTPASSKFKTIQDWIAGRELAAAAALGAGVDIEAKTVGPPFVDDLTVDPPVFASPQQKGFIVEHGKAIDEAYLGREPKTKYLKETEVEDPPGSGNKKMMDINEFVPDRVYETYEEMSGLTRAYVNFMFECDPISVFNNAKGAAEIRKAKEIAEYVAFYREDLREKGQPEFDPPSVPGRWVMMQQYPVVDGWDDVSKSYKTDPPDMIP